jgi:hypothetical protein
VRKRGTHTSTLLPTVPLFFAGIKPQLRSVWLPLERLVGAGRVDNANSLVEAVEGVLGVQVCCFYYPSLNPTVVPLYGCKV